MSQPIRCTIVKRLNRFVAEVIINGKTTKAYINNTGRLIEYLKSGKTAFCTIIKKPQKTRYRLFAVKDENLGTIVDTYLQVKAFEKAIELGFIPWLSGFSIAGRNVRLGKSLIDYLLKCDDESIYLEVKSAVLRKDRYAMYPDCPSLRGQRHMYELMSHVREGGKGAIIFIAAMPRVEAFKPYRLGDQKLYELLLKAHEAGVTIKSFSMHYNPKDSLVYLDNPNLDVILKENETDRTMQPT
ncbi:DNA/RNA nuclease SfsA [Candidatus Bathyarchaeota archaeon]|nr:DNA/RNA nuclease SfsA [Candidatus Bathyarchaeota archaeon]